MKEETANQQKRMPITYFCFVVTDFHALPRNYKSQLYNYNEQRATAYIFMKSNTIKCFISDFFSFKINVSDTLLKHIDSAQNRAALVW